MLPSWTLPVLIALVGGGGAGYVSSDFVSAERPAVLATQIGNLSADIEGLEAEVYSLRADLAAGMRDRWTRSDHDAWVENHLNPRLHRLEQRLEQR